MSNLEHHPENADDEEEEWVRSGMNAWEGSGLVCMPASPPARHHATAPRQPSG